MNEDFDEMSPEERGKAMDAALIKVGMMPPDCTLFPPEGAKIVMNVPMRSDRKAAAERLARLLLRESYKQDGMDTIDPPDLQLALAEARRVLGDGA